MSRRLNPKDAWAYTDLPRGQGKRKMEDEGVKMNRAVTGVAVTREREKKRKRGEE